MKVTVERAVRITAGVVILISLGLALTVSRWWLLLTAYVGVNLIQSAFTGFCLAETIFRRLGLEEEGKAARIGREEAAEEGGKE